ncbi:rhodanese-like domain-containing protein [Rhodococcus rhodochrous]|uniref:Rhodanese domain-containing protein n=1 Tax=Rhodococcus rhodochrous KG-21 TaxID=1441923 RepID=A0A0M9WQ60_RHORH|nr:rhodanese-like domain-containing protein [Rhodococcus rhodochrous]KOS57437.1 hypothetical protein Z051_03970 [Rhodococcus rhodochrous KG-21]
MRTALAASFVAAPAHPLPLTTERIYPAGLAATVARGAVVVDIRTHAERAAQGTLPGALAISADLLPRRLHPADDERLAVAVDRDVEWVVVSASGAETDTVVAGLQALGLRRVTGLAGGYAALAAAGATGAIAAAPHVEDDVARVTAH